MDHGIAAGHDGAHRVGVGDVAHDQFGGGGKIGAVAARQVVEHAHAVAGSQRRLCGVGADKAGAAGEENMHSDLS